MKRMITTEKRFTRIFTVAFVTAAVAGLSVVDASAQGVITPTTNSTSTTYWDAPRTILAALDGSNLSAGGASANILEETTGGVGSDDHWLSHNSAVDDDANFRSTTEVLTFDLGGTNDVNAIYLWPYIRLQNNRGLKTCDISFSTDGGVTYPTTIPAATLGDFTIGPQSGTAPVQTKSFATQSDVTHIRLTNLTTFGSTGFIAISELRFGSPGGPPPPPSEGGTIGIETIGLHVTNHFGVIKWQKSVDGSPGSWSDVVPVAGGTTLDVTGLYGDTPWFRVEATNGTNAPAYSTTTTVELAPDGSELTIH